MSTNTAYAKRVMEDLDALLADLQSCASANKSYSQPAPPREQSTPGVTVNTNQNYHKGGASSHRDSHTPPPLPPPPYDIPESIPPPQEFTDRQYEDQPLYETQNIRRDNRHSGSSQGSADQQRYYTRDVPPPPAIAPQQQQQGSSMISNNLSELDQLLSDLNSAQFMAEVDKKHSQSGTSSNTGTWNSSGKAPPPVAPKPGRGGPTGSSVDTLLDQLESSVPNSAGPHGGYPVQNNMNGQYSPAAQSTYSQGAPNSYSPAPPNSYSPAAPNSYSPAAPNSYSPSAQSSYSPVIPQSSSATQELDDLMQSLSGFKMKDKQQAQQGIVTQQSMGSPQPQGQLQGQLQYPPPPRSPSPGSEPSYAKPHKSRNLSQSSSATSSLQSSNMTANMSATSSAQGGQLESMLGDLQSDLSKQGVNTKTKGLCAACNQPVVGQVITALGKIWHIEHFTCDHCHETLGTKNFYERDGVAYCERDYHSLFAPRCAYCNGPITDKCVTALDRTWHPEHFFCAQCGRPFGEDGFHEKDGKAYCRADFFEMFAPKCGGCGRAIVDNYISALNRHWHPECFACFDCHQPFHGGKFFDYEGLPYCETHYHAKRGSLCAGCQKPITGRCITAMCRKFHPEHFVCAFCLKQLNKGTFKEQNDRPYCHPCFVKLFG